jgi:amino acid permease
VELSKPFRPEFNNLTLHYRLQNSRNSYIFNLRSLIYRTLLMLLSGLAASFINTVILSSALSACNHAIFAGTRVLYSLSVARPIPQAPRIFSWTTKAGVPLPALLVTSIFGLFCFGSSFVGSGQLWGWLQNFVGVSNQVSFPSCDRYHLLISLSLRMIDCLVVDRNC